jgi:mono/diheme cytochrome c family protein
MLEKEDQMRMPDLSCHARLLLVVACGLSWMAPAARSQTPPDWVAPKSAAEKKNPILTGADSIGRGRVLYSNCVICHGPAGHGDGMAAVALNPKPKDLTSDLTQAQSDGALFWKISQGRAPMPPWEQTLSDKDRWDLVNYVRSISLHPGVAPPPTAGPPPEANAGVVAPGATADDLENIRAQMRQLQRQVHYALPGTEHLVIAGDGAVTFTNLQKSSSPSTFNAVVSPLILWEPTDRLLVTAAFDLAVGTDTTGVSSSSINVNIAEASVIVNDNLIVGGGLFVVPFGQYHNHFDPPWIEKLPDAPLAFGDSAIGPSSEVGIFAHGAAALHFLHAPFSSPKIVYDAYLANGPQLVTNDPTAAGSLNFSDFTDLNNGKAVGGRIGFLPFPNVETGYSLQYGQASPIGFPKTYVLLQAADLNWVQLCRPLGGVFTTRAEWIWSSVQNTTYDPNGKMGFGPLNFSNYRHGGYAELAYRPTLSSNKILRNLEFIGRYDMVRVPVQAPGGELEQRFEAGVDYWLTPSWVLKFAYAFDKRKVAPSENALFVQLGFGM